MNAQIEFENGNYETFLCVEAVIKTERKVYIICPDGIKIFDKNKIYRIELSF